MSREAATFRRLEEPVERTHHLTAPGLCFHRSRVAFRGQIAYEHCVDKHMLYATIAGGTRRGRARTGRQQLLESPDRVGSLSFVPAGAERRVTLEDGCIECAHIEIAPGMLAEFCEWEARHFIWRETFNALDAKLHNHIALFFGLAQQPRDVPRAAIDGFAVGIVRAVGLTFGGLTPRHDDSWLPGPALRRVLELVEQRLAADPALSELADGRRANCATAAGGSASAWRRRFARTTCALPWRGCASRPTAGFWRRWR